MHVNAVALTECAAAAINRPALCHLDVKAHKLHASNTPITLACKANPTLLCGCACVHVYGAYSSIPLVLIMKVQIDGWP